MKVWRLWFVAVLALSFPILPNAPRSGAVSLSALPSVIATVNVGATPRGIGIDETRNLVYVSNFAETGNNKISKIDGASHAVSTFSNAVSQPFGVAVNSAANRIYVANNNVPELSILRGEDGTLASTATLASDTFGAAYNPATGKLYVTSFANSALYRVNTADNSVKTISLPGPAIWVALNPTLQRAYVTVSGPNTVAVINTATDEVIGEYSGVFGTVAGIAVNSASGDIFVTNALEGAVTVLDSGGNFKGALDAGRDSAGPRGVAVNPNTGHVFVANYDRDRVYVFDAASVSGGSWVSAIVEIPVGDGPEFGIAVNTTTNRVYVANYNGNTVSVISDPPKTIQLSSNSLSFVARPSGTTSSRVVTVDNAGTGTLSWSTTISYTNGSGWITATPASGATTPMNVTVGINTAPGGTPLVDGTYTGQLTVSAPGAVNTPQVIEVRLVITGTIQNLFLPAFFANTSFAN